MNKKRKKLDLKILSKIGGFKVEDYEISICGTEIHYGTKGVGDYFVSMEEHLKEVSNTKS